MRRYADLEIAFRKRDERSYSLAFRFNGADDEAEQRSDPDPVISVDFASLKLSGDDPSAYAAKLNAALFTPEIAGLFGRFRSAAEQQHATLRVRLSIESSAPELHAVHWEMLRDPFIRRRAPVYGRTNRRLPIPQQWTGLATRSASALKPSCERWPQSPIPPAPPPTTSLRSMSSRNSSLARQAMAGIQVESLAPGGPLPLTELGATTARRLRHSLFCLPRSDK